MDDNMQIGATEYWPTGRQSVQRWKSRERSGTGWNREYWNKGSFNRRLWISRRTRHRGTGRCLKRALEWNDSVLSDDVSVCPQWEQVGYWSTTVLILLQICQPVVEWTVQRKLTCTFLLHYIVYFHPQSIDFLYPSIHPPIHPSIYPKLIGKLFFSARN